MQVMDIAMFIGKMYINACECEETLSYSYNYDFVSNPVNDNMYAEDGPMTE